MQAPNKRTARRLSDRLRGRCVELEREDSEPDIVKTAASAKLADNLVDGISQSPARASDDRRGVHLLFDLRARAVPFHVILVACCIHRLLLCGRVNRVRRARG